MNKLYTILFAILFLPSCSTSDQTDEPTPVEIQDPLKERISELDMRSNNGTITLEEQSELDSLENELYKKELKENILNMTGDN